MTTATQTNELSLAESVGRVRLAQTRWEQRSVRDRLTVIRSLRHLLVDHRQALCEAGRADVGKPPQEVLAGELLPLADACKFLDKRAAALLAPRRARFWQTPLWMWPQREEVHRRARGVIAIIGTWNYPLFLNGMQLIQALAAGNGVVWKPSELAPQTAVVLRDLLEKAGVPPGLVHIMPPTREGGPELVEADIDHLVFTGANATGKRIAARLGERLISSTLELSGCDALFVLDDADLALAARSAWFGATVNRGQTCIAVRRVFVPQQHYKNFIDLLHPLSEKSPLMRLALPAQARQAQELVQQALSQGARLLHPEQAAPADGHECRPAILVDARPDMQCCREASFAPLMAVMPYSELDEAIAADAQCSYGLGTSIFTRQPQRALALAGRLKTGVITVNDVIAPIVHPTSPFGGMRQSGWGSTQGAEGLLEMTVPQVVSVKGGTLRPHLDMMGDGPDQSPLLDGLVRLLHGRTLGERWRGLKDVVSAARTLRR